MTLAIDTTLITGETIITDSINGGVAVDYSGILVRIATALETIATNSTTLATNSTTIATNSTTVAGLVSGTGVHIIGPWEWLGMSSIIKYFEEQDIDLAALKASVDATPKSF